MLRRGIPEFETQLVRLPLRMSGPFLKKQDRNGQRHLKNRTQENVPHVDLLLATNRQRIMCI